jgi:homocitrate synthase
MNTNKPIGDFLSNVGRFKIIESTLRGWPSTLFSSLTIMTDSGIEGEQFASAYFTTDMKIQM